jgi:hypothetical protein
MEGIWPYVTGALAVVGGVVITTIKDLITRHFQRKDKELDRQAAREDGHRAELRAAYAEFIAAYSRFLNLGGLMNSIDIALEAQSREGYEMAIAEGLSEEQARQVCDAHRNKDLVAKSRQALDDFTSASIEMEKKLVNLILLEGNREFSEAAHRILA